MSTSKKVTLSIWVLLMAFPQTGRHFLQRSLTLTLEISIHFDCGHHHARRSKNLYTSIQIPTMCSDLKLHTHWRDQRIRPTIEKSMHIQRSWWRSSRLENLCTSIQMATTRADRKFHIHWANPLSGLRIENSIQIDSNSHYVLGSKTPYTLTWSADSPTDWKIHTHPTKRRLE